MKLPPPAVIASARASQAKWRIPASITIGQWALESSWGTAVSGKNNYGGVTAKVADAVFPFKPGRPLEPATLCWTREQWQGARVRCQRWFKDYPTPDAYFDAHGKLLATSSRYARARAALPDVEAFAHALTGIYATAEDYGDQLVAVIRRSNLTRYDA